MVQRNPDFLKYFSSVNKLESRAHLSLSFHQIFTNNLLSTGANANGATFLLINSQSGKNTTTSLEQIEDQTFSAMITFQV